MYVYIFFYIVIWNFNEAQLSYVITEVPDWFLKNLFLKLALIGLLVRVINKQHDRKH